MLKRFTFMLISLTLLLSATRPLYSDVDRGKIREGLKHYQEEQWGESLDSFQDALLDDPTNPLLHFNVGSALYKNKKFEEAQNSFEQTLATDDASLQEKAYYNLGNTFYQMNKYQEAIDAYKKALELDPQDQDAKYNLEFVRAKLKEMAKKEPMQNQQQNQQGQQQQQQGEGQGENQEQQEQQQQQQENQQEKDQQQQQNRQQQQQAEEEKDKEQQQQAVEEQKRELTKEEAEQILRALRSKAEANKKLRPMPRQSGKARVEKDW